MKELLTTAQRRYKVEARQLEEETALSEELRLCLMMHDKPEGHESDSWETIWEQAKQRRERAMAYLRGMYMFSVMDHLTRTVHGRAFRAWAYGQLDPVELLCYQLGDFRAREKHMMQLLLRPIHSMLQ